MKRVGEVVRIAQGLAIARCPTDESPDIGTMVVDQNLDTVGRVVDVFGPVSKPYLAVTPSTGTTPAMLIGSRLYAR